MDSSFYLANLRKFDVLVVYDSDSTFLIVCSIRLTAMLGRFEFRKSVVFLTGFTKVVLESTL